VKTQHANRSGSRIASAGSPASPRNGESKMAAAITSIYLQGIDNAEIIETVHGRRAPMVPVSASLRF
jgi:hypothetical protein